MAILSRDVDGSRIYTIARLFALLLQIQELVEAKPGLVINYTDPFYAFKKHATTIGLLGIARICITEKKPKIQIDGKQFFLKITHLTGDAAKNGTNLSIEIINETGDFSNGGYGGLTDEIKNLIIEQGFVVKN